ncbi:MAG: hypothetical protein OXR64_09255, partial [Chloroflexota bacterium]|nr:hypothetical protein [Chloroflexota bacterium]
RQPGPLRGRAGARPFPPSPPRLATARGARLTVAPECRTLIEEFGLYRYHEASDRAPISEIPIDRDNHAVKALVYWLFDRFGAIERPPRQSIPFRITW